MTDISMHIIPPAISSSIANDQFQVRAFVDWFPCIGIRHLSVLRVGWEQWCSSSDAFIPCRFCHSCCHGHCLHFRCWHWYVFSGSSENGLSASIMLRRHCLPPLLSANGFSLSTPLLVLTVHLRLTNLMRCQVPRLVADPRSAGIIHVNVCYQAFKVHPRILHHCSPNY
jgi:hypothetical protein